MFFKRLCSPRYGGVFRMSIGKSLARAAQPMPLVLSLDRGSDMRYNFSLSSPYVITFACVFNLCLLDRKVRRLCPRCYAPRQAGILTKARCYFQK